MKRRGFFRLAAETIGSAAAAAVVLPKEVEAKVPEIVGPPPPKRDLVTATGCYCLASSGRWEKLP